MENKKNNKNENDNENDNQIKISKFNLQQSQLLKGK